MRLNQSPKRNGDTFEKTGARGEIRHEKIIRNLDTAFGDAVIGKKMKCQGECIVRAAGIRSLVAVPHGFTENKHSG